MSGCSPSTLGKRPNVKKWIDKIGARDAVKRAYAKIGAIKSVRDTATDDAKDRYFGRGKYAVRAGAARRCHRPVMSLAPTRKPTECKQEEPAMTQ